MQCKKEKTQSTIDTWNNCSCPICGKGFHLKPFALNRFKTHYCSKRCFNESKKILMKGEGNHQYGIKGGKNSSWKSDTKMSRYGYIQIRQPNHPFCDKDGWVLEHRLVAEKHLLDESNSVLIDGKMYLSPEYVVHHKNFDRKDNRIENLKVMTKGEHQSFHAKLNMVDRNSETGRFEKNKEIVRIKRVTSSAIVPERKSVGAACYDLYADNENVIEIRPHETVMIGSGIAFEIPSGYFGAIYARSGISTKRGLRPSTCVSVIDSDYRGEVGLPIHNDTKTIQFIKPHERVAQIVFQQALDVELVLVEKLKETERGSNGFGSTGR